VKKDQDFQLNNGGIPQNRSQRVFGGSHCRRMAGLSNRMKVQGIFMGGGVLRVFVLIFF